MKKVAWARWLARFDLEPTISAVLRNGLLLSVFLIGASLLIGKFGHGIKEPYFLHSTCIPRLILQDIQRFGSVDFWPRLFLDLGISVLMATSYVRILVAVFYAAFIARDWKTTFIMSCVLLILSIMLFTDIL